jgi:hypothetical protein
MAQDFRATQVETTKIILSGGIGTQGIGGLVYSGSVATNRAGGIPASMISQVGSDVFLFVSGTKSNNDFNRTDVTLFGGDIVVSGTIYAERQVMEVDSLVDGDLIVTGNLLVEPDADSVQSVAFRTAAGANILTVDATNNNVILGDDLIFNSDSSQIFFGVDNEVTLTHVHNAGLLLSGGTGGTGDTKLMFGDAATFIQQQADGQLGIDADSLINITAPTLDIDIASSLDIDGGSIQIDGTSISIDGTNDSNLSVNGSGRNLNIGVAGGSTQVLSMSSGGTGNNAIDINATAGGFDLDAAGVVAITGAGINLDGGSAEVDITTTGAVDVNAAGITVDGSTLSLKGTDTTQLVMNANTSGEKVLSVFSNNTGTGHSTLSLSGSQIQISAGDSNANVGITGSLGVMRDLIVSQNIRRRQDPDTKIVLDTDKISLIAGDRTGLILNEQSLDDVILGGDGTLSGRYDRVLILSGGASTSQDIGNDVNFFVSGAVGGKNVQVRSTSLFGGDLVVSGTLHPNNIIITDDLTVGDDLTVNDDALISGNLDVTGQAEVGTSLFVADDIAHKGDGDTKITFQPDRIAMFAGNKIFLDAVEAASANLTLLSLGSSYYGSIAGTPFDKVLILSGGAATSPDEKSFTDTNFFVSGAIGSSGTSITGTAVFGGDVVTSGSFETEGAVRRNTRLKSSDFNVKSTDHFLFFNTSGGHVTASLESAATAGAGRVLVFKDVKGSADNNYIVIKPNGSDEIEGINDETKIKVASGSLSLVCDGTSRYFIFGERD